MNINLSRQLARREKINQIKATILKYEGVLLKNERKELILTLMSKWNQSERVIKEYIKVAEFEIKIKK